MPEKALLVRHTELLEIAKSIGYDWNLACCFMSEVLPDSEDPFRVWEKIYILENWHGLSEDALKVMTKAFEEFDTEEFHLYIKR